MCSLAGPTTACVYIELIGRYLRWMTDAREFRRAEFSDGNRVGGRGRIEERKKFDRLGLRADATFGC